ncbi:hypothetical protein JZ751_018917 [Albula glossodonta]|uniref:Major facilitator superfamily domain-containing protein 3 n=1 Tax=Albula glossodonta TaxID=121402 RepID=A0A8T2MTW6_9TELE|nr:hypothetical protein JZ751_018917 [Albula glossodonta]
MNSKLLFLALLYFVQGMPYGLQSSLLPIYLRTSGLSLTKISLTKALYFPWILKVLWAPLVDRVGTKKRWLVGSMLVLSLTCLACSMLSPATDFTAIAAVMLAMNFLASVQDIAVDGVAVRLLSRREEVGYGNTVQVVGYKLGSVLAGGGLLAVMDLAGWGSIFLALGGVYAAVTLFAWTNSDLDAPPENRTCSEQRKAQGKGPNPWAIWQDLLAVPSTKWTAIFQGAVTMFPLFLLDHYMTAAELGFWNSVVAMGFSILGSSIGGPLLSNVRALLKKTLVLRLVSMAFQTSLLSFQSQLGLVKVQLSGCPSFLMGGGRICAPQDEPLCGGDATHYSFLATLEVLGKLSFSALAGWVVDWMGFQAGFLLFCFLSAAATLHKLCQFSQHALQPCVPALSPNLPSSGHTSEPVGDMPHAFAFLGNAAGKELVLKPCHACGLPASTVHIER